MLTKAEIQMIRSLGDKKERAAAGLFVAEGAKLVVELAGWESSVGHHDASGLRVRRVLCTEEGARRIGSTSREGCYEEISRKEMERISFLKTPSEMLALVEIPHYSTSLCELSAGLVLALDGVQDPGNMGTILRLADWFGIRAVVCSQNTADCYNPKVVQATMGAIARVRVHYTVLEPFLRSVVEEGVPVFGTFLQGESLYDAPLASCGVIVMGSEGQGISDAVAECVTHRLFIPPYPLGEPTSESLNVATATAIICSEFRRR